MSPAARLGVALAAASAYSAVPAAWYHTVQEATDWRWTTAVLFTVHGVGQVAAMSVLARPRVARRVAARATGAVVAALLVLDAAGAVLLAAAPAPGGFWLLLAGRAVTGCAIGALTPLATAGLTRGGRGTELATVAILGAVGAGSLGAGALSAAGWSRAAVLALGAVPLVAGAWLVRGVPAELGVQVPTSEQADAPAPTAGVALWAVVAFACNGVLGLFCSTLPGVVAGLAHGATAVAGATTGIVMVSAGVARLALGGLPTRGVVAVTAVVAAAGGAALGVGLTNELLALALAGAAALGAAAGVGFDAALRTARPRGVAALARVQRGGQLGLVLPVLAYPVVVGP